MIRFTSSTNPDASAQLASDSLDGAGGTLMDDGLVPQFAGQVQEEHPFRGDTMVRYARGGVRVQLQFAIWTKHDSLGDAIGHVHTEPRRRINQKGALTHTDQVRTVVYPNAVIAGVSLLSRIGNSTVMQYTITADPPSS